MDQFGSAVALNYHGEDAYKTKIGALATVFVQILTLYSLYTRGADMILGTNPDFISYTISQDMDTVPVQNMADNKFNMAFGLYNLMGNSWDQIPEEFGYFRVLKWEIENMDIMPSKKIPLGIHACKPSDFPMATPEKQKQLSTLYCIDDYEKITLRGDFNSKLIESIYVGMEKCNQKRLSKMSPGKKCWNPMQ